MGNREITSNVSFSHSVFKRLVLQIRKNQSLFGKKSLNNWNSAEYQLIFVLNIDANETEMDNCTVLNASECLSHLFWYLYRDCNYKIHLIINKTKKILGKLKLPQTAKTNLEFFSVPVIGIQINVTHRHNIYKTKQKSLKLIYVVRLHCCISLGIIFLAFISSLIRVFNDPGRAIGKHSEKRENAGNQHISFHFPTWPTFQKQILSCNYHLSFKILWVLTNLLW